jgi:hypothetical protein
MDRKVTSWEYNLQCTVHFTVAVLHFWVLLPVARQTYEDGRRDLPLSPQGAVSVATQRQEA